MQTPLKPVPTAPSRELLMSTRFLLKRLGLRIKDRSLEAFEGSGLHPQHYAVLSLLDEQAREAQASIADALGYDRSQLVGLLDELEQKGLVERRRDPDDRRRHVVSLTPAGKKTYARLREVAKQLDEEFLAPLDAAERKTLHALLLELAAYHDPRCGGAPSETD